MHVIIIIGAQFYSRNSILVLYASAAGIYALVLLDLQTVIRTVH